MNIYIDESGVFRRSQTKPHSISCVGAAIIPGRHQAKIERDFQALSKEWPRSESGEIKGRLLNERHVADLCQLLASSHVLFEASVMDMNLSEDADIEHHKAMQANGMTANLTDDHHPNLVEEVWRIRQLLEQMPLQLYAQAVALTEVVCKAYQTGQLYFCQRYPGELARFRWVIDAKDKNRITDYEDWWQLSVMPLIESRSRRKPTIHLKGGDYSVFRRNFPSVPIPEHQRPIPDGSTGRGDDLNAILGKEMEFAPSETYIGLQIVDILTNALRRCLSGHLKPEGWEPLRKLLIYNKNEWAISLINLSPREGSVRTPYARVINRLNQGGLSMIKQKSKRRRPLS